jgi:hypothetical protein
MQQGPCGLQRVVRLAAAAAVGLERLLVLQQQPLLQGWQQEPLVTLLLRCRVLWLLRWP